MPQLTHVTGGLDGSSAPQAAQKRTAATVR
jgi:hypothetical protein